MGGWRHLGHSGVTLTAPSAAFPSRGPDQEARVGPRETYSEDRLCGAKTGCISHPAHLTLDSARSQRLQLRMALGHHTMHRADPLRLLPGGQRRPCPAASACPSPRAGPPAELQAPGRAQRCPLGASIPQQREGEGGPRPGRWNGPHRALMCAGPSVGGERGCWCPLPRFPTTCSAAPAPAPELDVGDCAGKRLCVRTRALCPPHPRPLPTQHWPRVGLSLQVCSLCAQPLPAPERHPATPPPECVTGIIPVELDLGGAGAEGDW